MSNLSVDLDKLATHLKNKIKTGDLSVREAAQEIGFGATTLIRLLQGSVNENVPDLTSVNKAVQWVGRSFSDFSVTTREKKDATIADVEVQLRALPGLEKDDIEALMEMVRISYAHAKKLRAKKRP